MKKLILGLSFLTIGQTQSMDTTNQIAQDNSQEPDTRDIIWQDASKTKNIIKNKLTWLHSCFEHIKRQTKDTDIQTDIESTQQDIDQMLDNQIPKINNRLIQLAAILQIKNPESE